MRKKEKTPEELSEKIKNFFLDEVSCAPGQWASIHGNEISVDGKFNSFSLATYLLGEEDD